MLRIPTEYIFDIVVVDNFSPNKTGIELQKMFSEISNIHIILNNENGGFSKGNNVGYLYAKKELKSDYIIVLNNDVIFEDYDFLSKMKESLIGNYSSVIAPSIINSKGYSQNPLRIKELSLYSIFIGGLSNLLQYFFTFIGVAFFQKFKTSIRLDSTIEGIVPHGAIIIYTPKYVSFEDFAFYPITFLYAEEDIMSVYYRIKNYKVIYNPLLQIRHEEDYTINKISKNQVLRKRFISKNKAKAYFTLLKVRLNIIKFGNNL
jgi:GT2 family glycosyltransferase